MKLVLVLFSLVVSVGSAQAQAPAATQQPTAAAPMAPAAPAVLSFLEWKSMRVHEAQQKLEA
ncbi:hypothetical protein K2X05_01520, partial [bacterium]|nr:hypothetical protein [bacterium]